MYNNIHPDFSSMSLAKSTDKYCISDNNMACDNRQTFSVKISEEETSRHNSVTIPMSEACNAYIDGIIEYNVNIQARCNVINY